VPEEPDGLDAVQAQALCDLVDDPRSGITRIRVVSARDPFLDAVEEEAGRRGLRVSGSGSTVMCWKAE
jgi:hypothetical protein